MRWGHTDLYPNQYIVLIGPSGVRKAEPLLVARRFLKEIGVELIAESITRPAFHRRIKEAMTSFDVPYRSGATKLQWQSAVCCVLEELAVFLENDGKFIADLTNIYDSRDDWTYETKNQGTDELIGACVNIIASMAQDWIPVVLPPTAIGGGFTSRMIFVMESRKGKTVTNPNKVQPDQVIYDRLLHDLHEIHNLGGEMIFNKRATDLYEEWYEGEEKKAARGEHPIRDPRFSGYCSRRQTLIKKLCMVLSAARSDSLVIDEKDFNRGLKLMLQIEPRMSEVFGAVGLSKTAEQTHAVLEYIKRRTDTTRTEVLREMYRDVDWLTLEQIEITLRLTGMIKTNVDQEGITHYLWVE